MQRELGSPFGRDDVVPDTRRVQDYVERLDPRVYFVKGMFVEPLRKQLGHDDFESIRPFLADPPRRGYVPFRDYPQHDHSLVLAALCDRRFPELSHAEALRRMAREDIHALAESTFGKVLLALVDDPRVAIGRFPAVYEKVAPSPQRLTVEDLPDGRVQLDVQPNFGCYGYQLGQVEEVVTMFGGTPSTEVWLGDDFHCRFVIAVE